MKKPDFSSSSAIKLSISAGIFLALTLIKIFDPGGANRMSGAVDEYIGDKTPLTIEAIGKAISGGDSLIAVFQNLSDVLTGRVRETAGDIDMPSTEPDGDTPIPPEDTEPPDGIEESDEELKAPPLVSDAINYVSEDELIYGGGFGIDDTLPLPFGYDAPPNVDYTRYDFAFEYALPLEGEISSGFGYREHPIKDGMLFHYGTDIAADFGSPVSAFAGGAVETSGYSPTFGNYLLINHADGVSSFYAHCGKLFIKGGEDVAVGQVIAEVGSTGQSTGPHLHFELRYDGMILDPGHYIFDNLADV